MIYVSRINDEQIAINDEMIEYMEETPDTAITLTTGRKFVVKESIAEIIERIIIFRKQYTLE
jgi:flagellar protein FlbD